MSAKWENTAIVGVPYVCIDLKLNDIKYGVPGVYVIRKICNDKPIYVGQAKCLRKRLEIHEHGNDFVYFGVLKIRNCGTLTERLEVEGQYIKQFILEGHSLLNECGYAKTARKLLKSDKQYTC